MVNHTEEVGDSCEPVGGLAPEPASDVDSRSVLRREAAQRGEPVPTFIDKRRNIKLLETLNEPTDYRVTPSRLSNVRWPVGEEPYADVPATDPSDPWINIKLDVTEHPDPGPNQRKLLGGGPALTMPCGICGKPLHLSAVKDGTELLEEAGKQFRPDADRSLARDVAACVCSAGHVTQLWYDMVERLIQKEN